jgi:hypothetical protein
MKNKIVLALTLSLAFLMAACGDSGAALKKTADSLAAAVRLDSIHDSDSLVAATAVADSMAKRMTMIDSTTMALAGKWWENKALASGKQSVFVKDGQPLPPARGRAFFVFMEDGNFAWHPIAPADGNLEVKGTWATSEKNVYTFTYGNVAPKNCPKSMKVVSILAGRLKCELTW